jgi:HEPN domain
MSDRAERLRREVWRWLRLAREDLAAAMHLAEAAHLPHRVACLLAQQAAEKAIKAVLVAEDTDPPPAGTRLTSTREPPATPWSAWTRQPGSWSVPPRWRPGWSASTRTSRQRSGKRSDPWR